VPKEKEKKICDWAVEAYKEDKAHVTTTVKRAVIWIKLNKSSQFYNIHALLKEINKWFLKSVIQI
jgi:hypothetical protein